MQTKIIEVVSDEGNYGKLLVMRPDQEWNRESIVHTGGSVLAHEGWGQRHLLVVDLATGEGAFFPMGGLARADLDKHKVWVCPLFQYALEELYRLSPIGDLDQLPDVLPVGQVPLQMQGYRRGGPERDARLAMSAITKLMADRGLREEIMVLADDLGLSELEAGILRRAIPPPDTDQPYIECPDCGRRSFHPKDIEHGWCSACSTYTSPPAHARA